MKASIDAAGSGAIAVPVGVSASPSSQRATIAVTVGVVGLLLSVAVSATCIVVALRALWDRRHDDVTALATQPAVFVIVAGAQLAFGIALAAAMRRLTRDITRDDEGFRRADIARAYGLAAAVLVPFALLPLIILLSQLP